MTRCLDIHTHHPEPQPEAVIATTIDDFNPREGQFYSVGFHPWTTSEIPSPEQWTELERIASLPNVVAIGECGVDKIKGGPMYKQLIVFNRQIEISEKLKKPVIIHDVKAHDIITGLKRDLNPTQKWLIHGFRGKPTVAKMMINSGIYLSFGAQFNADSLPFVPKNMILAETDDAPVSIQEVIANLYSSIYSGSLADSNASSETLEYFTELIAVNSKNFLFGTYSV